MSPWDRCITRGVPGGFFPAGYNNAYQIVQSPGYVVIHYEMIHARADHPDRRACRTCRRTCASGTAIRSAAGKATRWSSTSPTTTARAGSPPTRAAGRIRGVPQSDALHVVERFTRDRANTIDYEVTIDDPKMYTRAVDGRDSARARRRATRSSSTPATRATRRSSTSCAAAATKTGAGPPVRHRRTSESGAPVSDLQ